MAIINITSANAEVFPSAERTYGMASGKYTSENNLTGILRSITDKDNFVVGLENGILEVVLHGYYFKLQGVALPTSGSLYAHILVENSSGRLLSTSGYTTLDEGGNFIGILLDSNSTLPQPSGFTAYNLLVSTNGQLSSETCISSKRIAMGDISLENALNNKQDKITEDNKLSGYLVKDAVSNAEKLVEVKTAGSTKTITPYSVGKNGLDESGTVYFDNGIPKLGITFFKSQRTPTGNDGNVGDIWFKY